MSDTFRALVEFGEPGSVAAYVEQLEGERDAALRAQQDAEQRAKQAEVVTRCYADEQRKVLRDLEAAEARALAAEQRVKELEATNQRLRTSWREDVAEAEGGLEMWHGKFLAMTETYLTVHSRARHPPAAHRSRARGDVRRARVCGHAPDSPLARRPPRHPCAYLRGRPL